MIPIIAIQLLAYIRLCLVDPAAIMEPIRVRLVSYSSFSSRLRDDDHSSIHLVCTSILKQSLLAWTYSRHADDHTQLARTSISIKARHATSNSAVCVLESRRVAYFGVYDQTEVYYDSETHNEKYFFLFIFGLNNIIRTW